MSRRCCCDRPCIIWDYQPQEIGEDTDPPWLVEAGSIEVIDDGLGNPVLEVSAGSIIWHRTPNPVGWSGKVIALITYPSTAGSEYRILFNSTGLSTGNGHFRHEYIPYPTGASGTPQNARFYKNTALLVDCEIDAPRYYALEDIHMGATLQKNQEVRWKCRGVDGLAQLEDVTLIEQLTVMAAPSGGRYVGLWFPDSTALVHRVRFFNGPDHYSGLDAECLNCHCSRCDINDTGETGVGAHQGFTVTFESSCVALDGFSHTIEPDPDPASEGGLCAGFIGAVDAITPCYDAPADSFPTPYLAASDSGTGKEWPVYKGDSCGEFPHEPIRFPNENSTCVPFYLEYGPFPLGIRNPEDPPELWICCCPSCDIDECEWFSFSITR